MGIAFLRSQVYAIRKTLHSTAFVFSAQLTSITAPTYPAPSLSHSVSLYLALPLSNKQCLKAVLILLSF